MRVFLNHVLMKKRFKYSTEYQPPVGEPTRIPCDFDSVFTSESRRANGHNFSFFFFYKGVDVNVFFFQVIVFC